MKGSSGTTSPSSQRCRLRSTKTGLASSSAAVSMRNFLVPDARPDQEGSFPAHSVLVLKPQDGWQRPLVVERSARCIPGCLCDLAEELLESRRRIYHQALR